VHPNSRVPAWIAAGALFVAPFFESENAFENLSPHIPSDPAFESSMGLRAHDASFALSIGISGIRARCNRLQKRVCVPLGRTIQAKCVILPDHFSSRSLYRSATDLIYIPQVPSHCDVTILLRQRYSNFINMTFYLTHITFILLITFII